ncbi:MAG: hypothetical protein Q7T44_18265 [Parvibaculum sp.]|nr:hypothetical protein [Parvibaculum sp.]
MTSDRNLHFIQEPKLAFGNGQAVVSPKDGLFLFGPVESRENFGSIRIGVVGTGSGIAYFRAWIESIQGFIPGANSDSPQHRPFPGFAAVFGVNFPRVPVAELVVDDALIDSALFIEERHQAIYRTVDVFSDPIRRYMEQEEVAVDIWFVLVPERVHEHGRPKSVIPKELRLKSDSLMNRKLAKNLLNQGGLFDADDDAAIPYYYEVNFHNQIKSRLLEGNRRAVIQLVRETTIAPHAFLNAKNEPLRKPQDPATIAWNLCTTTYFKAGLRPWRLKDVRPGVCYIGLVFKQVETAKDENAACCGAQMFLDSGDGLVFRGAVGPWRTARKGEYHLQRDSAEKLIRMVIDGYYKNHGCYPKELFLHGKTYFNDDEWAGFRAAVPEETNLVGVRISDARDFKLFRFGSHPIIRGTAFCRTERSGYLWTRGYIPYLKTYPGRETPNPLRIDVVRGEAPLLQVMQDIMGLTKLNFNACIYGDGLPVTLRFADSVGEILTAGPASEHQPPLPFKHYI